MSTNKSSLKVLNLDFDDLKESFSTFLASQDKFKDYNDKYGLEKGDEVIKETARILIKNVRAIGGSNAFIGHIGGDDFVFIAHNDLMDQVCQTVIADFEKKIPSFYSKEDYERGSIISKDRQGKTQTFGLLSISVGVVSNSDQNISHVAQIAEIGAELKQFAKASDKSNFVRDKRHT